MESKRVYETFVQVGGIPTKILSLKEFRSDLSPEKLLLIIPGNPGLADFYRELLLELQCEDPSTSVWCIGYAGHHLPPPNYPHSLPNSEKYPEKFDLPGQIKHKINFIRDFVPDNCQLTLIGHSIGAKMALEVFKHFTEVEKANHIKLKNYLLFPVIERMYASPNGPFCWFYCAVIPHFVLFLVWLITFIPLFIRRKLIGVYVKAKSPFRNEHIIQAVLDLVNPIILKNVFLLGRSEMSSLYDLSQDDVNFMKRHNKNIRFYYGTIDQWCPLSYKDDLLTRHPEAQVNVCKRKIEHAFILGSAPAMAETISEWTRFDS